jgi:hypothetical protein
VSDQPKHPDIEDFRKYDAWHIHELLDKAGAVQADANGLFTVEQRIARLGADNLNHVRECRQWRAAFDVPSPALVNLPRTGDGRKIVPGMTVWSVPVGDESAISIVVNQVGRDHFLFLLDATQCRADIPNVFFSTRDAAEKARAGK